MPRVCCKLHRLLDSAEFPTLLKNYTVENFCIFLQETVHKRTKYSILFDNPNDVEIYFYLFAGSGTRYLSTVAGEFVTFTPEKAILSILKWYPVIATKQTHQTKSLTFVGKTNLATGLLLLISYYENYLKQQEQFQMYFHMTIQLQVQTLLFVINHSRFPITTFHWSTTNNNHTFITDNQDASLFNTDNITIRNHFPHFLCHNCNPAKETEHNTTAKDSWDSVILTLITNNNWTKALDHHSSPPIPQPRISSNISTIFSTPKSSLELRKQRDQNTISSYQMHRKQAPYKKKVRQPYSTSPLRSTLESSPHPPLIRRPPIPPTCRSLNPIPPMCRSLNPPSPPLPIFTTQN